MAPATSFGKIALDYYGIGQRTDYLKYFVIHFSWVFFSLSFSKKPENQESPFLPFLVFCECLQCCKFEYFFMDQTGMLQNKFGWVEGCKIL